MFLVLFCELLTIADLKITDLVSQGQNQIQAEGPFQTSFFRICLSKFVRYNNFFWWTCDSLIIAAFFILNITPNLMLVDGR